MAAAKDCKHQPDCLIRLEGGIYTYCRACGSLKRNGVPGWASPSRTKDD